MDNECKCQSFPFGYTGAEEQNTITCTNVKKILIDFGKAAVCGEHVKTFTLDNLKNDGVLRYKIKREPNVDPLYQAFNFKKSEGFINPGERLKLKIIYKPVIPFEISIDTFEFTDSSHNVIKIRAVGESTGPRLSISVKRLNFFITPTDKISKRTFEIKNISDVPAQFLFDRNKEQDVFQVVPVKGTLQGQRHMYVEVYFVPQETGFFAQQLNCLTWCDDPFAVELFGIYKEEDYPCVTKTSFKNYPFSFDETIGYAAYLQDSVERKNSVPPFSLSRNNIDFGRVLKDDKIPNCQVTSMTNHMKHAINVKWPKDDNAFKIIPRCLNIPRNNSALFECYFTPSDNNALYSKMLTAQINWISHHKSLRDKHEAQYIPITATLRVQGHSFPEEESWIANIDIFPPLIILPPCLPGNATTTNFKILASGHLPIMYKLVPPKKTNIIMKPMSGVIIHSYAIIAVQLYTEKLDKTRTIYSEEWFIELNGRKERQVPLCIRGEASIPAVVLGKDNSIKFESVQPGSQSMLTIPMRNTSSFQIRYKFDPTDCKFIEIVPTEGNLFLNDEVYIRFCYTGDMCAPKVIYIKYALQAIQKIEELVGEPYFQTLTVHTKCALSQLCAIPNHYSFGNLRWGALLETEFHLFNFGESTIYFKLNVFYRSGNADAITLDPQCGEGKPGEKIKINISGVAKTIGEHIVNISYGNRISSNSKELIQDTITEIFDIRYKCSFPTIQVQEIVEHTFGPLFGKEHFWKYLNIDRLNNILREINNGETKTLHLNLPEFEISAEMFYITLLVKNVTSLEMDVYLKRKQLCDCPLKEEPGHINIRKKVFDCLHREMLAMELQDSKFHKHTEQFLTIKVRYLLPEETVMKYILYLGDDRNIEISFSLYAIPDDILKISCYKSEDFMLLANIPVYRRVAPIQIYWLYNNTNKQVSYKMDVTILLTLCQRDGFEIMKCLNPEGVIQPYSSSPLMIKFHPIEMKIYTVTVPLILGETICELSIIGIGRSKEIYEPILCHMPAMTKRTLHFLVNLSVDKIIFNPLLVWSTAEKVVFLRNITKDKVIQYFWGECTIDGVLEVTAAPKSGVLRPKESHAILIKIISFNEACITDILLPCNMLNRTQLFLHKKSLELYNKRQEEIEAEFTITEKGIFHEENEVPVIDKPIPFTLTVNINVNIIHTKDRDTSINLEDQFSSSPQDDLDINVANILKEFIHCSKVVKDNDNKIIDKIEVDGTIKIGNILEELITDFTFSKSFREIFKTSHNDEPPFYRQFIIDDRVLAGRQEEPLTEEAVMKFREREIKHLFTQPKPTVLSETLKDLIFDSIHETFRLGMMNPAQDDIDNEIENMLHFCSSNCKCKNN